jgi:Enterobacteriaceae phage serine recombinase
MKIGYARVSTEDQNLDMQRQALGRAGCDKIFEDTISGAALRRSGLARALRALKPGDVLIVWKLDRLGRSLLHLIDLLGVLGRRRVEFFSLSENIDTTTAGGRLVFHVMAALAEFERALIGERTREGLAAARMRGARLGRRKALCATRLAYARARIGAGESAQTIARSLQVGRSTLYRALRAAD